MTGRVAVFVDPAADGESLAVGAALSLAGALIGVEAELVCLPEGRDRLHDLAGDPSVTSLLVGGAPAGSLYEGLPLVEALSGPVRVYLRGTWWQELHGCSALADFSLRIAGDPRLAILQGRRSCALPVVLDTSFGVRREPRLCVLEDLPTGFAKGRRGLEEVVAGALSWSAAERRRVADAVQDAALAGTSVGTGIERALGRAHPEVLTPDLAVTLTRLQAWVLRDQGLRLASSLEGLPVDFFGSGWGEALADTPGFACHPPLDWEHRALSALFRAGVVTLPRGDLHPLGERLCTALVSGVPVIAPWSPEVADATRHRSDVRLYAATGTDVGVCAREVMAAFTPEPSVTDLHLLDELSAVRLLLELIRGDVLAADTAPAPGGHTGAVPVPRGREVLR